MQQNWITTRLEAYSFNLFYHIYSVATHFPKKKSIKKSIFHVKKFRLAPTALALKSTITYHFFYSKS